MPPIIEDNKYIDVICQFCKDGRLIPLRLRITDNDDEIHTFTIKQYRDLTPEGAGTVSDFVNYRNNNHTYECKIEIFDTYKIIKIFYNSFEQRWRIL